MQNQVGIFHANLRDTYGASNDVFLLEKAKELGYDYIEFDCEVLEKQSVEFFEKLNELEMIPSVYAFTDCDGFLQDGRNVAEVLPWLAKLGVSELMLVCGNEMFEEENRTEAEKRVINAVNMIGEKAKEYGIGILFEDFDSFKIPCGNTYDLLRFTKKIPTLGVTFDTGNFIHFEENPFDSYEKLKNKIRHCHVKDRDADEKEAVTGEGSLPIKELIELMVKDGYKGRFSIEMFGIDLDDEKLKKALTYVKNILTKLSY